MTNNFVAEKGKTSRLSNRDANTDRQCGSAVCVRLSESKMSGMPIWVAERFEAGVYRSSLAGIAASNLAGGIDVSVLWL